MLKMKQHCEKCNASLSLDGPAYICSYECTYCRECTNKMDARCPNCNGELAIRPKRLMRG